MGHLGRRAEESGGEGRKEEGGGEGKRREERGGEERIGEEREEKGRVGSSTHKSLSLCLSPQAGAPYLDPREDPSSGDAEVKVGNELGSGHLVVIFKLLPRSIVSVKNGGEGLGVNKAGCLLHVGGRGRGKEGRGGECLSVRLA